MKSNLKKLPKQQPKDLQLNAKLAGTGLTTAAGMTIGYGLLRAVGIDVLDPLVIPIAASAVAVADTFVSNRK